MCRIARHDRNRSRPRKGKALSNWSWMLFDSSTHYAYDKVLLKGRGTRCGVLDFCAFATAHCSKVFPHMNADTFGGDTQHGIVGKLLLGI